MIGAFDVALAVLVAVVWGVAFVATKLALESFSPPELTALRFLLAAIPAAWLARPTLPWRVLVPVGLTLFAGQFLFQFFGIAHGMPPGLAAVAVQTQAFFTVLFGALMLRETPSGRQLTGMVVAAGGLGLIATTAGDDLRLVGFGLTLVSAVSWGIGNVLLKRVAAAEMLPLVAWLSLVPPLPALVLSVLLDGPLALPRALLGASPVALGAVLYLGVVATVLAYAVWGGLLRRHPVATVAPFALLVPGVGALASWLALGERFGPSRLAGVACVLLGLAVIVLPLGRAGRPRAAAGGLVVSPADRRDVAGVVALIGRVYAEYGFVFVPAAELPDLVAFERHYAPPHGAFFVVRERGVIVGSVGVERLAGGAAELHRLYLDRHLRGRGVGRALVEAVLGWCRAEAVARLVLWSDTRFEEAHRLYARLRFRRTGERTLPDDPNATREYRFERPVRLPD